MDKRHLIFISSTFRDLEKERNEAMRAILDLGHIPAGMERFPAMDEEQMDYIKSIIDDCDYYVLIIGGKYGSVSKKEGKSYTELEYDYAVEKDIPVLVFEKTPIENSETDTEIREKFEAFRKKAKTRLIKSWSDAKDLRAEIALSLPQQIKRKPAIGWVRADNADSAETLGKLTKALEENAALKAENEKLKENPSNTLNLVLDTIAEIKVRPKDNEQNYLVKKSTWRKIFFCIAQRIYAGYHNGYSYIDAATENMVGVQLVPLLGDMPIHEELERIRMKFEYLDLIAYKNKFWVLTEKGKKILLQEKITRKPKAEMP